MQENIKAVTIDNDKQMNDIFDFLKALYEEKNIPLASLDMIDNKFLYHYIKSHRSNVTEGNTTTVGEFTELVINRMTGNNEYVVPSKAFKETYEIDNLVKTFLYLEDSNKYNLKVLLSAHRILGKNILDKNLDYFRGKLKTFYNFVPFKYNEKHYNKYFVDPSEVKDKLDLLFIMWNKLDDSSRSSIFAKYVILQIELISIHPFIDGNGRVSRAISESYLESYNLIPYTPYSKEYKREYQKMMGEYSIMCMSDICLAYKIVAEYFLEDYDNNLKSLLSSIDNLEKHVI